MKTVAAVLIETGRPLELVDLEVPPLKPGQLLVEILISGVCHTQVLEARGYRGEDPFLPHCLGHEGVGIVREAGSAITKAAPGDHVILSWLKGSGADVPGTVYTRCDGQRDVNAGGVTTFSEFAVVSENRVTSLPPGVPREQAALLGCAAPTGVGAVFNTAAASAGSSIVIFGCGGVGLCAIAGAAAAGCAPIVAVDVNPTRLALAMQMGATHAVSALEPSAPQQLRDIVAAGFDFAIEATGRPQVMQQALQSVRPRGGAAVIIGNARAGQRLEIDPQQLNQGKRLLGTWGGDCLPDRDLPRFARLISDGRLNLRPLIAAGSPRGYGLADINEALDDLESGACARPMIDMARRGALVDG